MLYCSLFFLWEEDKLITVLKNDGCLETHYHDQKTINKGHKRSAPINNIYGYIPTHRQSTETPTNTLKVSGEGVWRKFERNWEGSKIRQVTWLKTESTLYKKT